MDRCGSRQTVCLVFLLQATGHERDTNFQTYVFCHMGSIRLRIPSAQLVRTLKYVGNMKDDDLACFILILDEYRARKHSNKKRKNP